MTKFEGTRHGKLIASQMLDVAIRVRDVRPFAVRQMVSQLLASNSLSLDTNYCLKNTKNFYRSCVFS